MMHLHHERADASPAMMHLHHWRVDAAAAAVLALLLLAGCQAAYGVHARDVRDAMARGEQHAVVERALRSDEESEGGHTLALLERGLALHDAGRFAESRSALRDATDALDRAWHRRAADTLLRHTLTAAAGPWLGAPHERVLAGVYLILDELALGQRADALVEVRRLTARLAVLADARGQGARYRDDALAELLAALLYAEEGSRDDARICLDAARKTLPPADAELPLLGLSPSLSSTEGELVLVDAVGLAPEVVEERLPAAAGDTLALPSLRDVPWPVAGARLRVDGEASVTAVTVEDVSAIAHGALEDARAGELAAALARRLARAALGEGVQVASAAGASPWLSLTRLAGGVAVTVARSVEAADLRSWFALPAHFDVARARVTPGEHTVEVELLDARGRVLQVRRYGRLTVGGGERRWLGLRS